MPFEKGTEPIMTSDKQKQFWLVTIGNKPVVVHTSRHHTAYYAKEKAFSKLGCEPTNEYLVEPITEAQAAAWEIEHQEPCLKP